MSARGEKEMIANGGLPNEKACTGGVFLQSFNTTSLRYRLLSEAPFKGGQIIECFRQLAQLIKAASRLNATVFKFIDRIGSHHC